MADFNWKAFLETLSPTKTVPVEDITGARHICRPTLPARREIQMMDKLSEVFDLVRADEKVREAFAAYQAATEKGMGELMRLFRVMLKNPDAVRILAEAFSIAYPSVYAAALVNVRADAELAVDLPAEPNALDLFSASELLGGLLPFAARTVGVLKDKIKSLQSP